MFNYVTYKYVVLKDARLGILYYALVSAILLYTLVEIFVQKGYLHVSYFRVRKCYLLIDIYPRTHAIV